MLRVSELSSLLLSGRTHPGRKVDVIKVLRTGDLTSTFPSNPPTRPRSPWARRRCSSASGCSGRTDARWHPRLPEAGLTHAVDQELEGLLILERQDLAPVIDRILPLSEARRAQELSQSGHTRGKIVLRVVNHNEGKHQ